MSGGATGFVVAGGLSRRMGRDKARLPWGSATLLAHACARLGRVCEAVRLLTGETARYQDAGWPTDLDALPGCGPLAGVLAGMERLDAGRAGLFLALDMPFVTSELLAFLLELGEGWDAVVPRTESGPEPLCALYRASCAAPARVRLTAGERHMTCFWPDVRVRHVGPEQLRAFGDPARLFANLNTPDDYARDASPAPSRAAR